MTGGFGGRLLASGSSMLESVGRLERGRTTDSIVFERPVGDAVEFQELPLSGAAPAKAADDLRADEILTDPVSGLWVGTLNRSDQPVPTFFDPHAAARARAAFKAFPGQWTRLVSYTSDLGRMIIETGGSGDSGTYWLVDIASGKADPIAYEHPDVKDADVGPIRMVEWKAADGLVLRGVLSLPPGRPEKNLPLIVMPHGGPEARDYPTFDWWAQLFASRGYAVFQPNFRGSSGYGVEFRDAGFGQMGRKMQTDISDGAIPWQSRGSSILGGPASSAGAMAATGPRRGSRSSMASIAALFRWPA
jgi:hypothetical protein